MARRNQKQRKVVPVSRAHPARSQATTDSNRTIHTCAGVVCKDFAGRNTAAQTKIRTEDEKARDELAPSGVSFNVQNSQPRGDGESPCHVSSNTSTLSERGFQGVVHQTPSAQASQRSLSKSEAPSAPAADTEEARAGQLEKGRGEATSRNRANDSVIPDDQADTGDLKGTRAEHALLGRGQRHKKPSLRAQEAAQAAQKIKAGVPTITSIPQQSRKRKRGGDEREGTRRGKGEQNNTHTSTGANGYSLRILIAAAVTNYFEVYERPELRQAAAQGLLALTERR